MFQKNSNSRLSAFALFMIVHVCIQWSPATFAQTAPIGLWHFNDGSGSIAGDSSGNSNDGILNNMNSSTCWADGKVDSALDFDGTDDYISISTVDLGTIHTVTAWIYADSLSSTTQSILGYTGKYYMSPLRLMNYAGNTRVYYSDGVTARYVDFFEDITGGWRHVAVVRNGTAIDCYLDGVKRGSVTLGSNNTEYVNLVGALYAYPPQLSYFFDGTIDELQLYDEALSAEDIQDVYWNVRGRWEMNEGTGTVTADSSGNSNTGTLTNMDTPDNCWVNGNLDSALDFDGTDDYISISTVNLGTIHTVTAWIYADSLSAVTQSVLGYTGKSYMSPLRLFNYSGNTRVYYSDGVTARYVDFFEDITGGWRHVAVVRNGTAIDCYLDGVKRGSVTLGSNNTEYVNRVGALYAYPQMGYFFDGMIENVCICSRGLSQSEMSQYYVYNGGDKDFGCESNPTGNPIGGGAGYTGIYTSGDYEVDTSAELLSALSDASSGDVIFVDGSCTIDLTGNLNIAIPAGVTLASDRGYNGSSGALIKDTSSSDPDVNEHLFLAEAGVRITGLRIQGPNPNTTSTDRSYGISCADSGLEVDNCEISGWGYAGICLLDGGTDAYIHHNYIHNCQRDGLGYGVSHFYGNADSLIEANKFDYNRHCVAGTGTTGNSYEARYNLILEHSNGHIFDMHGGADRNDDTNIAGDSISIHHNTVMHTTYYSVAIRGIPNDEAAIYNNWFYREIYNPACIQYYGPGNYSVYDNLYSEAKYFKSSE